MSHTRPLPGSKYATTRGDTDVVDSKDRLRWLSGCWLVTGTGSWCCCLVLAEDHTRRRRVFDLSPFASMTNDLQPTDQR